MDALFQVSYWFLYIIAVNILFLLIYCIALIWKKGRVVLFTIGAAIQFMYVFGSFLGIYMDQEKHLNAQNLIPIIFSLFIAVFFFFVLFAQKRTPAIPSHRYKDQESKFKTFVVDESTGEVVAETNANGKEIVEEYCPKQSEQSVKNKEAKQEAKYKAVILLLLICLAVSTSAATHGVSKNKELESKITEIEKELSESENELENAKKEYGDFLSKQDQYEQELNFLNSSIGFIINGSDYYHNFWCDEFQNADEYWAHNLEYCRFLGYEPCPYCWPEAMSKYFNS